ncbi:siroheme decarboxylase subunit beta [Bradyrhizobium centrosematis]|uniref:siroheme decarboxylase subunit beta n=1 Tax=Bradyrhizobium centrosematis TaxID=1300039 RepID=UPI0021697BB9|nr:Lrp/AsnC family transcriptional regulator [Bradyrhizobium centrosematis]MCS3760477.1 DNA-binding Lrp family transcriptional regulator [Bradyrhizobium centrosematis]MCS3771636.1 DNA-binding Lrp family transcriptional regulator [Bradyrhizobium centrosematis]
MTPSSVELALIDRWQHDFPLVAKPFEIVGRSAALDEQATISVFRRMRAHDLISRVGAVVRPNTVGASTLAALHVPPDQLDQVAEIVSREPLVTHNYEREHDLNLWFVVAGGDAEAITETIDRIEAQTGLPVVDLPMVQAYHLGLGFSLREPRAQKRTAPAAGDYRPDPRDQRILAAIENGLPLVEHPYRAVADQLALGQDEVIARLEHLVAAGVVTRFGCVVRHDKLGFRSNAMAVWNIPDEIIDDVAAIFARHPSVTLCYQRPRRPTVWPYNLFCMVHARSRDEAYAALDEVNLLADTGLMQQAVLFSKRCFKQRGAVFSRPKDTN